MKLTIYYKSNPDKAKLYSIELNEYQKLSKDYQSFLQEGIPVDGVYLVSTWRGDESIKTKTPILLAFAEVASII